MDRKKAAGFRPSVRIPAQPRLPSISTDRLSAHPSPMDARSKLLSQDMRTVAEGAFELREAALKGEDISMAFSVVPSRLRAALSACRERASSRPPPGQTMPVMRESAAKVYLSECIMLSAKNGFDISSALSAIQPAMADSDIHVRHNILLALGHHASNGHDISLFVDTVVPYLHDVIPMNREAAVWALKVFARKGKLQAHGVLMSLGNDSPDDACISDVRETCHRVLGS